MNSDQTINTSSLQTGIYYRLIALWVLCEAMLGGIIHGFRIPVSGLFVGSGAVTCICLIAWYQPVRGAIIKATLIVAIFKMMLSPQAPIPAYIAVFFQGAIGELIFFKRRWYTLACVIVAVLSLLESGLQRILMLTIVYGNDLWKAINGFVSNLVGQRSETNYSLYIISWYVLMHLLAGIIVGIWASSLPERIRQLQSGYGQYKMMPGTGLQLLPVKKKKKRRIILLIIWIVLILLYAQSYFEIGTPLLPSHISLRIFIRSIIIVLTWYFILGPLLKKFLENWLQKKKQHWQQDIQQVVNLLPATQQLITSSWNQSKERRGWKRVSLWVKIVLINTVESGRWEDRETESQEVRKTESQENTKTESEEDFSDSHSGLPDLRSFGLTVFSLPIQSGKTTSLINWSANRKDVHGILTPVVNRKRMFMNVQSKEQFPMEASGDEETISVGRFLFSKKNFEKAIKIIHDAIGKTGWLIIDEIGPLELRGEGFYDVLIEVVSERKDKLLLVIREGLVDQCMDLFQLDEAIMINDVKGLEVSR